MTLIKDLTIAKAKRGLIDREYSAKELVEYFLGEISKSKKLNSYITENFENALI